MKIRVMVDDYEYQGLKKGSVYENVRLVNNGQDSGATFLANGKVWYLIPPMYEIVEEDSESTGPIKSDGGSSSYYELEIKNKAGETFKAEVGDVIRAMVGNDFDFGNCVKALRRMYLCTKGAGKAGVSLDYDGNKVKYFIDEILAHHKPRKDNAERSEDCSSS